MNKQVKKILILIICSFFTAFLFVLMQLTPAVGAVNYNGVLQAVQFFCCLVMVIVDNKKGRLISNILLSISMVFMLRTLFFLKILSPLPGICNMIIYLFTLNFLGQQLRIREDEIVTDFLTGLKNMRGLYEYLFELSAKESSGYLVNFSLENYRVINEGYGHLYGEQVIKEAAKRIKENVSKNIPVFHIRDDEFAIVIPESEDSYAIVQNVLENLNEKFKITVKGKTVNSQLFAYAGLAMFPLDTESPDELLRYANVARERASEKKGDCICYYDKQVMLSATVKDFRQEG